MKKIINVLNNVLKQDMNKLNKIKYVVRYVPHKDNYMYQIINKIVSNNV